MKIEVNPAYRHLADFIKSLPRLFDREGEVIYRGRNELRLYTAGGMKIVIKRFRKPHIINRFVYGFIRPSKAKRSYIFAVRLAAKSINTPTPIGYLEEYKFGMGYSYYISTQFPDSREMRIFCDITDAEPHRQILEAFGLFTARLHNMNVIHKDYSPGNILFNMKEGRPQFSLVDINRMKFAPVGEKEGYYNLRRLWFPDEVYRIIARAYARGRNFDEDKAEHHILRHKNRFMENRYK